MNIIVALLTLLIAAVNAQTETETVAVTVETGDSGVATGDSISTGDSSSTTTETECVEATSCTASRCAQYPAAAQFCPCSCPPVTPACRESELCDASTCVNHPNQAHWFCPCTCPDTGSGTPTSGSSSSGSSSSGSSSSSSGTTTNTGGNTGGSTSGSFGPVGPSGTGSSGSSSTPPLRAQCEMLRQQDCYGNLMGSTRVCMWHARDRKCHDGVPTSAEDVCAQFSTAQQCSARQAPNQCCWDAEGYCDKYDASDCRISNPYQVVPEVASGGMYHPEYEHPEYEHPEYEHPEYEHPEYEYGHPALQKTHVEEESSGAQVGWMIGISVVGCVLGFGITMRCTKAKTSMNSEPLARHV